MRARARDRHRFGMEGGRRRRVYSGNSVVRPSRPSFSVLSSPRYWFSHKLQRGGCKSQLDFPTKHREEEGRRQRSRRPAARSGGRQCAKNAKTLIFPPFLSFPSPLIRKFGTVCTARRRRESPQGKIGKKCPLFKLFSFGSKDLLGRNRG